MKENEKLKALLENVSDSYEDFVIGGLRCAKKHKGATSKLIKFIEDNPTATTSDIIQYETEEILGIKPIE